MPFVRTLLASLAALLSVACVLPTAVAPAPAPVSAPVPAGPLEVIVRIDPVRLDPADRALLEELLTRGAAVAQPAPAPARAVRGQPPLPRQEWPRILDDGPVLQASHVGGAPLYEGTQVQLGERWVRHGDWRAWYPNGQAWEQGAYFQGEEHGPWRWWYENGQPQARGTFDHGVHVDAWSYSFENGQTMAEGSYAAGRPLGRWRTWSQDGALLSEGEYADGLRTGRWSFYRLPGVLDAELSGLYEQGERVGD